MRGGVLAGLFFLVLTTFLVEFAGAQPPDFRNSLGMTFVWIPPGDFMMGAAGQESGRGSDEPRHQVTITRPFYLQNREVTQVNGSRSWGAILPIPILRQRMSGGTGFLA